MTSSWFRAWYFNPRSLAGATYRQFDTFGMFSISIHAPLRERLVVFPMNLCNILFQSTLPCGSDHYIALCFHIVTADFNPRSLAGATGFLLAFLRSPRYFNPRSLAGATCLKKGSFEVINISIHAPLRERHT